MEQNKFITRLRKLRDMVMLHCTKSTMDAICGDPKHSDATISSVLSDLDTCIDHCIGSVHYTPPSHYLKQLNHIYKYYNSKTYAS